MLEARYIFISNVLKPKVLVIPNGQLKDFGNILDLPIC